jgi:hypothetical protein
MSGTSAARRRRRPDSAGLSFVRGIGPKIFAVLSASAPKTAQEIAALMATKAAL